jgi:hypothetical protein
MNKRIQNWLVLISAMLLIVLGCSLGSSAVLQPTDTLVPTPEIVSTHQPTTLPVDTQIPATETPASQTLPTSPPPTSAPTEVQPSAAVTSGALCLVLQDLNLRPGPGTAYRPPIIALSADTELVPLGYNPTGTPGGDWVQVKVNSLNQIGWVSAGAQFVSCNIELSSLPSVAVAPPPPPEPPQANNSTPDGTFPPNFVWEADFNREYFVRFRIYDTTGGGVKDGDGIAEVSFQILDKEGREVYARVERSAGFCIFGGGEPDCNPWTLEGFTYKWKPGGEPVREERYTLLIVVIAKSGEQGNWNYEVDIDLP